MCLSSYRLIVQCFLAYGDLIIRKNFSTYYLRGSSVEQLILFCAITLWTKRQDCHNCMSVLLLMLFVIKSINIPTGSCDIYNYVHFNNCHTRSSASSISKLCHNTLRMLFQPFLQNLYVLPILWNHFKTNFDPNNNCILHFFMYL